MNTLGAGGGGGSWMRSCELSSFVWIVVPSSALSCAVPKPLQRSLPVVEQRSLGTIAADPPAYCVRGTVHGSPLPPQS